MTEEPELPQEALSEIAQVFSTRKSTSSLPLDEALSAVCTLVAKQAGIKLTLPSTKHTNYLDFLNELTLQSEFRYREIQLQDDWWQQDNGPLLGFLKEGSEPCALLPQKKGYEIIIPSQNKRFIIKKSMVDLIAKKAFYFYTPLPKKILRARDMWRFIWRQIKPDFWRAIGLQCLLSLLALAIPIATGYLFSTVIPFSDKAALLSLTIAMVVNAFIIALFQYVQIISLFRIKLKSNASLQAALWDRVLRFPISFFRQFKTGDLASRINAVDTIQQEMNIAVLLSLSSSILILLSLIFLFYLAPSITYLILIPLVCIGIVSMSLTLRQVRFLRHYFNVFGEIYALLLQLFSSMNKIRASHCEKQMFLIWLKKFRKKTSLFFKSANLAVISRVSTLLISLLISLMVYSYMILSVNPMPLGQFIMYNAVLAQLFSAWLSILGSLSQLIQIIPIFERVKPVLTTSAETTQQGALRLKPEGMIEFKAVVFNYPNNETLICDHINLEIAAGEYVGILGESGAGKSSIIKLLLGFEKPLLGSILYDNYDLTILDKQFLRSQLGVVLQTSGLMPGTLLENIIGFNTGLTLKDAWIAAKAANIASEIENIPMGMQTLVSERGSSLSVGQRQRILIARALAKKPRILILDESMSGIDNLTLSSLQTCIDKLKMTRIVITQRPAFLKNADKIYCLQEGKMNLVNNR